MLEQLSRERHKAGLDIIIQKTKVMRNGFAPRGDILLNNVPIEDVRSRSRVKNMMVHVDEAKHNWAGHVVRREIDGASLHNRTTQLWIPRNI